MPSADDILMGSGSTAAKFENPGDYVTGVVASEPEARQQTDYRLGTPLTWDDGSPKMQVLITLQTDLRDPEKAEDDGLRTVYVKGKNLTKAVRDAVRDAGAKGVRTGGTLTVQYTGDGTAEKGFNPPKLYAAKYVPPAQGLLMSAQPAAQVQQQVSAQQVAPAAAQLAASVLGTPATVGGCPTDTNPQWFASLSGQQQGQYLSLTAEQRAQVRAQVGQAAQPLQAAGIGF